MSHVLGRILGVTVTVAVVALLIALLLLAFGGGGGLLMILMLLAIYGWILFSFLHYRYCRREELLQVLAAAADNDLPLAPAVRAYLADRPRGDLREFWMGTLLAVFPFPGYYWIWHRRNTFDRKVDRVVHLLEQGVPLFQALEATPGVGSRDMVLAAAIGQSTGRLSQCLRGSARRPLGALWIELLPQFVYPFVMMLVISSIVGYLVYFIMPKFRKIFLDFGVSMPKGTMLLSSAADWVFDYFYLVVLGVAFVVVFALILSFDSTARWFFPGLGAVYRRGAQSRVLQLLSSLLQIGKPVPESMSLLAELPLGRAVLRRLNAARFRVERGEPLAECLLESGLLPISMVPLVHASERSGNLPWVLGELADSMHNRTFRTIQRIMQAVFPIIVIAMGALIGMIVIGMFLPLVKLITELSG